MIRLAVLVLVAGGLVACNDDAACAASSPTPDLRGAPWPTITTPTPERPAYQPPHAWPKPRRTITATVATSTPADPCHG